MNKVKMFFVAAALLLTTAGVFAGKAKFDTLSLYGYNSGLGYTQISSSGASLPGLTTTHSAGNQQAKITDISGSSYGLYTFTSPSTYTAVYSISAW